MRHLFKLTVRTAVNMDLVDLAVQAIDGTKLQANAAKDRTYDAKGLQRLLRATETVIEELEKQNEAAMIHRQYTYRKTEAGSGITYWG